MTLADLAPGQWAEVVAIASRNAGRLHRLSALGMAPGSVIRLQQRAPVFVVWVGETQLSLERDVALEIEVALLP